MPRKPKSDLGDWVPPFAAAWAEIVKGEPSYPVIGRHLEPLVRKYGSERLYAPWRAYLAKNGEYSSPARFVATWGRYEAPSPIVEVAADPGPVWEDGWLTEWMDNATKPR